MNAKQENSQGLTPDIEEIFLDSDAAEGSEPEPVPAQETMVTPAAPTRGSRRLFLGLAFSFGLLLGWLVIGWWLWPVQWANSDPWHLDPKYQRTFVTLVAEEYWRTSDVFQANEALAGWDRQQLADLLTTMKGEATNPETRQHLAALGEALEMPGAETALTSSLLSQKGLLLGMLLSAVPLLVAIAIVVSPLLQQKKQSPQELQELEEQSAEQLEELLADVQLEDQPAQEGQQPGPAQEQEQQEGQEETEEEGAEQAEPEDQNTGGLGDLLNLFEEEDTSIATLEAFCKGLPDVSVDELFEKSKKVASHLHKSNDLRAYEAGNSG
jgi:hypothetical protein